MEDWKDEILNSTKGINKAVPPVGAFDQILSKVRRQGYHQENSRGWLGVAAAVSIIILMNVFFIVNYSNKKNLVSQRGSEYSVPMVSNYNIYGNE